MKNTYTMLVREHILPAMNPFEHSYMDSKEFFQADFLHGLHSGHM